MSRSFYIICLISVAVLNRSLVSVAGVTLNLGGNDWRLEQESAGSTTSNISVSAKVPGEVHLALFEHGLIEDPLYRYNDVENKWVAWSNWTYSKQFNVSNEDLKSQQVDLVLEGVDTVAEVFLNGQRIGLTRNMFRRYVFSVKHLLWSSTCNLLAIKFVSPVWYARQEAINYPYRVPPECPPDVQHGECSYNFIRKAAYSFSWDWGPSYPSIGVWKDLYLNMFDYASLEYVTCETAVDSNIWRLQISTFLLVSGQSFGKSLKVIVSISQLNVTYEEIVVLRAIHQKHDVNLYFNSSLIKMWWPYGMGDQVLYAVVVRLLVEYPQLFESGQSVVHKEGDHEPDLELDLQSHFELDSKMIRIGFRTVDLVQDYVQEDNGLTFYFSINNQPLFLKGSNWIPMTNFLTNQTSDEADWLLRSAIEVNMNVLRVWGGGVYETDEFYQRADELGIMIWQDFMFACALYPTNRMFLDDVRLETIHQVRRLKHHPSIIIWSGNNENEGVLANNWYGISDEDFPMYKSDYVKLYVDVIRDVMLHEDMSRPYIPSSPTNGLQTMKEGWVSKNPQDVRFGDIHFYNYTMDGWQPASYLKPRMASEFGFQSWSSAESLLDVSRPKDDWKLMGEFALHRQHHSNGEKEIFYEINQHMEFNLTSKNDTEHFIHYVYLSQISQAMSVRAQTEHYRRSACRIHLHRSAHVGLCGDGGTMGAVYWQLNDVWQAPTWSSIEHNGKWKLLHYYARHFFSSYLISPVISGEVLNENGKKDDVIQFYSIIDHMHLDEVLHNSSNLTLTVTCYQIELFYVAKTWTFPYDQKTSHKIVHQIALKKMLNVCRCQSTRHCFLKTNLITNIAPGTLYENFFLLDSYIDYKLLPLTKVLVKQLKLLDTNKVEIIIETNHFVFFVWLEAIGFEGVFSDNGFLMTEKMKIVTYHSRRVIKNIDSFRNSFRITNLYDVYSI